MRKQTKQPGKSRLGFFAPIVASISVVAITATVVTAVYNHTAILNSFSTLWQNFINLF